ncbi:MAG: hypothetical protein R2911_33140 [Caldilineaceae bacterium]
MRRLAPGDAGNGYYQYTLDLSKHLGKNQADFAGLKSNASITGIGMSIDDVTLDVTSPTT